MRYYYLDEQDEVCGPFSAADMRRLRADGTINDNTLAAEEGSGGWRQLTLVKLEEQPVPKAGPAPVEVQPLEAAHGPARDEELGVCPRCGRMLYGAAVPSKCPHCAMLLHPGSNSLWMNIIYVLRRFISWKGRATRREFWSFFLFTFIVGLAMGIVEGALHDGETATDGAFAFLEFIEEIVLAGVGLISMMLAIRRFHDRGSSGWIAVAMQCSGYMMAASEQPAVTGYWALLWIVLTIYVLVVALLPSKRGPNKYGPSVLYPHG